MIYDLIIVGTGITGLYCGLKNKHKNILLLERNKNSGGNIQTQYEPQYECGAARFSNKHVILQSLLKKYKLLEQDCFVIKRINAL